MNSAKWRLISMVLAAAAAGAPSAQAASVTLDFDSVASGSGLLGGPLATSLGMISAVNASGIFSGGPTGNGLHHSETSNPGFARINFGFDAISIRFDFNGYGGGVFTGQALDAADNVVDTFFVGATSCAFTCFDGTGITLSGLGIRAFRFADAPGGSAQSYVDNITITVPEPTSVALVGLALLALGLSRRKA